MKQIDIIRTYAQKRCLVVDDAAPARAQLKRLLVDYGATDTDTAGNAEEAIELCRSRQYDIVISDYNLGQGKNGQQLLEELRFHALLRNTALFVMITAENSSHYVLHALEYQPDDFLHKPISRESLRPRLDAALLKSEFLHSIKVALDDKNRRKAIAAAKRLAQTPGDARLQADAKKMLAELYLATRNPEAAALVYEELGEERHPLWMALGWARIHMLRKHYDSAETTLREIIDESPYCVEAFDLLARVHEANHRLEMSQQALMDAVRLSPRSALRQRALGRISVLIDDDKAAVHAFRTAQKCAKHTCHEAADDDLNLAEALIRQASKAPADAREEKLNEARQHIEATSKRYSRHPVVSMRNALVRAQWHETQGQIEQAQTATAEALQRHEEMKYSVLENTSFQLCIDCAKSFMNRGHYDEGEAILQALAALNEDPELAISIDKLLREPKTREGIAYASNRNRRGIALYEAGDVEAALNAFREVQRELPNHIGLNLNLIQALIAQAKQHALSADDRLLLETAFRRIGQIEEGTHHHKRFSYLQKRYARLSQDAS